MSARLLPPLAFLLVIPGVSAQTPESARPAAAPPIVTGLFPPGASTNSTVEWTLTGRGFSGARRLIGLGPGVEVISLTPEGDSLAKLLVRVAPDAPVGFREARVEGPNGISNLVPTRIDNLRQSVEEEPNDDPARAQVVEVGTAAVGTIRPTDVDHYRIKGKPGTRVTLDLECRRLATAISPVLTVADQSGRALVQARELAGGDRDCRTVFVMPREGIAVVSLRDNVFGGSATAAYRLRIDSTPVPLGLFPLGGPRGTKVEVEVSGGTMTAPRKKWVSLPNQVVGDFDLGVFDGPDGPVRAPMRFVVGDENEVTEPESGATDKPVAIKVGTTVNGRIARPEEVDRYLVQVKKGERFRVKVLAAELGSWIDSVVTIRDEAGAVLAENDDEGNGGGGAQGRRVNSLGLTEGRQDSVLDFASTKDGTFTVEITDRYGEGGPAYPYRLIVGRSRPDFAITLLLGNPNAAPGAQPRVVSNLRLAPGMLGVFNLKPGSSIPVNFSLSADGTPGIITVTAEGLPPGVTVDPVKVDMATEPPAGGSRNRSTADALVFRVGRYAEPGMSEIRILGEAKPKDGEPIVRYAVGTVGIQLSDTGGQSLPTLRTLTAFPMRILGENKFRLVGPPLPPRFLGVSAPGVLLQGDRLDLKLEFDLSPWGDPGFEFDAKVEGVGLATNTVIASTRGEEEDGESGEDFLARVLASPKAEPGVYRATVTARYSGGRSEERSVFVIVHRPLEILNRPERLRMKPGSQVEIPVLVRREPGCTGEIEIKVEDLPRGVRIVEPVILEEGKSEGVVRLRMAEGSRRLREPREIKIVAVARMPRGSVSIESPVRPMIEPEPAEE